MKNEANEKIDQTERFGTAGLGPWATGGTVSLVAQRASPGRRELSSVEVAAIGTVAGWVAKRGVLVGLCYDPAQFADRPEAVRVTVRYVRGARLMEAVLMVGDPFCPVRDLGECRVF